MRGPPLFESIYRNVGLFHGDRFYGAYIDARAAIAARIGIDHGQTVFHRNGIQRT
jgi:hypothetical protein